MAFKDESPIPESTPPTENQELANKKRLDSVLANIKKKLAEDEISISFEDDDEDEDEEFAKFSAQSESKEINFIELAMLNSYLYSSFKGKQKDFIVTTYGTTDAIGRMSFGESFNMTNSYWFMGKFADDADNEYVFQPKMHLDNRNEMIIQLQMSAKVGLNHKTFDDLFKKILALAFNHSEYKGKCIKVKLKEGRFKGIEIIDMTTSQNALILNDVQRRYIEHFVNRVKRGKTARYLLNGEPGTGKTESIREIARKLLPMTTFVVPEFDTSDDLTEILEACEIFETCVIIMDDIDLYLGSRDNGSYTRLLGQFLSFFDGVKKRKISLLASTNDKGLVDKAAERPGRFNFTLDYSYLNDEQIIQVCEIHLPEKWRIAEIHDALTGTINGRKINVTGAFIANLAENIKEMSEDDEKWGVDDTISLIQESYKGFYSTQTDKRKGSMSFES